MRTLFVLAVLIAYIVPALAVCGDAVLDAGEECDRTVADVGCGAEAACIVSIGYACPADTALPCSAATVLRKPSVPAVVTVAAGGSTLGSGDLEGARCRWQDGSEHDAVEAVNGRAVQCAVPWSVVHGATQTLEIVYSAANGGEVLARMTAPVGPMVDAELVPSWRHGRRPVVGAGMAVLRSDWLAFGGFTDAGGTPPEYASAMVDLDEMETSADANPSFETSLLQPQVAGAASAVYGETTFVVGGRNALGDGNSLLYHGRLHDFVERVGAVDSAWSVAPTTGLATRSGHAALVVDGFIYLFFGRSLAIDAESPLVTGTAMVQRADIDIVLSTNVTQATFASVAITGSVAPVARVGAAVAAYGQHVIVAGGMDADGQPLDDIWVFDMQLFSWNATDAVLSSPLAHATMQVNFDLAFVWGGRTSTDVDGADVGAGASCTLSVIDAAAAVAGSLPSVTALDMGASGVQCASMASSMLYGPGSMYVFGGLNAAGDPSNTVDVLHLESCRQQSYTEAAAAAASTPARARCGDGLCHAALGESAATCHRDCRLRICGDGAVDGASGETCDEGPDATAACSADCTSPSIRAHWPLACGSTASAVGGGADGTPVGGVHAAPSGVSGDWDGALQFAVAARDLDVTPPARVPHVRVPSDGNSRIADMGAEWTWTVRVRVDPGAAANATDVRHVLYAETAGDGTADEVQNRIALVCAPLGDASTAAATCSVHGPEHVPSSLAGSTGFEPPVSFSVGTWTVLALVGHADGTVEAFVNGAWRGRRTAVGSYTGVATLDRVVLGGDANQSLEQHVLFGRMHDVALFDAALTHAQIAAWSVRWAT